VWLFVNVTKENEPCLILFCRTSCSLAIGVINWTKHPRQWKSDATSSSI